MQSDDQQDIDEKKKRFLRMMLLQWKKNKLQKEEQQQPQIQTTQVLKESGVFSREEYAQSDFWDKRYLEHKGYFDWYVEYPQLKEYFRENDPYFTLPLESKILIVGCGNSKLSEQMFDDGYKNMLSTDISKVVIERMNDMAYVKNKEGIKFQIMDSTQMELNDDSYDYLIDKGTLDALACDQQNDSQAQKLIKEMCRVAKIGVIIISHSSCQARKFLFRKALDLAKYQFFENKVSLSNQSELINIIRTQLKNKPMSHILQDKDALVKCLNLYKDSLKNQIQKQDTQGIIFQFEEQFQNNKQQNIVSDQINSDVCEENITQQNAENEIEVKIIQQNEENKIEEKIIQQSDENQIEAKIILQNQITEKIIQQNEENQITEKITQQIEENQREETIAQEIQNIENSAEKDQNIDTQVVLEHQSEEKKIIYAPKRQNFCFMYIIKKIR